MLISHRHRFIFLKPKKTAGTSVEMWLEPLCAPPGHTPTETTEPVITEFGIVGGRRTGASEMYTYWNHISATQLRDLIGKDIFDSYTKVATVRNPYDMLISAFHHFELPRSKAAELSVEEVVERFRNWLKQQLPGYFSNTPLLMVGRKMCVEFPIRYEHIHADVSAFLAHVGVDVGQLGVLPSTKRMYRSQDISFSAYFDAECIALVQKHARRDFDLFGYDPNVPPDILSDEAPVQLDRRDGVEQDNLLELSSNLDEHGEDSMTDDLIYSIFREIAAVEGKRRADGTWAAECNANDVQRILSRAYAMVHRAAVNAVKEEKA